MPVATILKDSNKPNPKMKVEKEDDDKIHLRDKKKA